TEICDSYEVFVAKTDTSKKEQIYCHSSVEITDVSYPSLYDNQTEFTFEFTVVAKRKIENPMVVLSIFNVSGLNLVQNVSSADNVPLRLGQGTTKIRITHQRLALARGVYWINLVLAEGHINNQIAAFVNCFKFEMIANSLAFGAGLLKLEAKWEIDQEDAG